MQIQWFMFMFQINVNMLGNFKLKNIFATQTHAALLIGIVNLHRYDEWYEMAIDKHEYYRISEIVYTIFVFNSKKTLTWGIENNRYRQNGSR